jgi:hypothetical protein
VILSTQPGRRWQGEPRQNAGFDGPQCEFRNHCGGSGVMLVYGSKTLSRRAQFHSVLVTRQKDADDARIEYVDPDRQAQDSVNKPSITLNEH